ncbi:MAG: PilN domain-containing protein [Phycisphaerae bacterium]|nr:PilN domain-containing protein [Phycisphaerae bacterium]
MATASQLNFLPEDYLEKRRAQRTNLICLTLFGIVMAGLILAFVVKERREAGAAQVRDSLNKRMESAGQQLAQIEEMQSRKEKMIRKADVTASLLERRPRHFIVALLTNALPKGCSLLTIELTTREAKKAAKPPPGAAAASDAAGSRTSRAAKPAAPAGTGGADAPEVQRVETLRVTGMAPDDKVVSRFIAAMDNNPLFKRVDLLFSEEHNYQQQSVRRFMLQIELSDQAQVTDDMVQSQRLAPGAFERDPK